jgi:hypothetical protein
MDSVLIVTVVLSVGWMVWGWLIRTHARRTEELEQRLAEMEQRQTQK